MALPAPLSLYIMLSRDKEEMKVALSHLLLNIGANSIPNLKGVC